jgi:hypothetical protein
VDPCHLLIPAQHCWAHGDIFIVSRSEKGPPFYSGENEKGKSHDDAGVGI